jgi:diguanylate cyclase (GGDEF)-like protein/PAS domain S-box-containing protein
MAGIHRLRAKYLSAAAAFAALAAVALAAILLLGRDRELGELNATTRQAAAEAMDGAQEGRARIAGLAVQGPLQSALQAKDPAHAGVIAANLAGHDGIGEVRLHDAAGQLLYRTTGPAEGTSRRWINLPLEGGLGSLDLGLAPGQVAESLAAIDANFARAEHQALVSRLLYSGIAAATLVVLAALVAWLVASRLRGPIAYLIRNAERMGQGDYSRPVAVGRKDELGDLASALERMRHRLRQTTITKDYFDIVLNSMNDAVIVTSPEGRIKRANEATTRLLGWSEAELAARDVSSLIAAQERAGFSVESAAHETRETVFKNRAGQEIPVSLSGSVISAEDPQFQGLIFVARNITDRKRAERRIRYLARYDALTKLPNRMQFQHLLQQAIARALRAETVVALLYLDLDRFKDVNDTFGHAAGDRTLEILSERLTRVLPKDAVVGRLAGDEFGVFLENLPAGTDNRPGVAAIARQLLDDVGRAFYLNDTEVYLTASVGIGFCPTDAASTIDLIRNADAAMYHSKQNGGNTWACYAPEMNAAAVERLMLKSKLRRSIERDEFLILYQPKVDLMDGRIAGAEALLRWRVPGHGDIAPANFIPLAEETNLIQPIGEWVLRRVCADYRSWRERVPDPGRVSINLSLQQLRQASFVTRCRAVFREAGVSPTSIELEITETTLMKDASATLPLLTELYAMGIHLSIDDFGTGYSSLSALQQLPVGTLKMDQSFVRDVAFDKADATLVRTIIELGRSLGLSVVAEGVESQEQLRFLRTHGCHYAQGQLFGAPLQAVELLELLDAQERGAVPLARYFQTPAAARAPGA